MEKLMKILEQEMNKNEVINIVLSGVKKGVDKTYNKVVITPFLKDDEIAYQVEYQFDKKVTHKNLTSDECLDEIVSLLEDYFKNGIVFTKDFDYHILISKKGKVTVLNKAATKEFKEIKAHNRKKQYVIEENVPCDFMVYLDIMNEKGRVYDKKRDKFKQINKFLEIVEDSLNNLNKDKVVNIVDFGCGKAYLTFALYHYLVNVKDCKVNIIGLDIKDDVIEYCNKVANDLNYEKLQFINADIRDFDDFETIDMIVTLHACDIATDAAFVKAVKHDAKVILSVPCCQHELFNQIKNDAMKPMLKHGLIKERLSALITDSMRTKILEVVGYDVSVIEFVAVTHTPKNLMIKAVWNGKKDKEQHLKEYLAFKESWGIEPYLEKELKEYVQ